MRCQLSCTKVKAQCDKLHDNRRLSNYVHIACDGRRSTVDLGPFIALSVHLCVQHDAREAARRAGPSSCNS